MFSLLVSVSTLVPMVFALIARQKLYGLFLIPKIGLVMVISEKGAKNLIGFHMQMAHTRFSIFCMYQIIFSWFQTISVILCNIQTPSVLVI